MDVGASLRNWLMQVRSLSERLTDSPKSATQSSYTPQESPQRARTGKDSSPRTEGSKRAFKKSLDSPDGGCYNKNIRYGPQALR